MAIDPEKLPSMKRTPAAPPPSEAEPTPGVVGASPVPGHAHGYVVSPRDTLVTGVLAIVGGLFFLALGANAVRWLAATLGGGEFSTGRTWGEPVNADDPAAGSPVGYFELQGGTAWTETAFAALGVALLVYGGCALVSLRAGGTGLAKLGLVLVGLATLYNLAAALYVFTLGVAPLITILAVAAGALLLVTSWPSSAR